MSQHQSIDLHESAVNEDIRSETRKLMGSIITSNAEDCGTQPPPCMAKSSFLSTSYSGDPTKDIGTVAALKSPEHLESLQTEEQRVLQKIKDVVGSEQVSQHNLDFSPPCIINNSDDKEISSNWADACTEIHANEVAKDANSISSHIVFKLKTEEKKRCV